MLGLYSLIKASSDLLSMGNNGKHSECRSFRPLLMPFIGMGGVWQKASDLHRGQSEQSLLWLLARSLKAAAEMKCNVAVLEEVL